MSDGGELVWDGPFELARRLERRDVSAREVLAAHLAQIERHDHEINAVVTFDVERAEEAAAAVDVRRSAGDELPVLAGVPITVKDSLMTAGVRTTSGAPDLAEHVPSADADVVARLRAAGAIVFAKTNLPVYANDVQTYNPLFGTTNNPWDLARTVGGSSGGSAAAVASGFTSLEIGSDIAGSIRNPAAMCGVVGHKPSYGIVSARGQIPGPPGTLTLADLAVIGPMARRVGDCAVALDLLAGPDDWHSLAWSVQLPRARRSTAAGLRVAVMASDPHCPVDPEIESAIERVAGLLESAGAVVDPSARPVGFDMAKADATFWQLLGAALAGSFSPAEIEEIAAAEARGESVEGELGVRGASVRHRGWLSANERRLQMRRRWREFFDDWDVVLAPVSPTVAIPHDHSTPQMSRTIDVAGTRRPYGDQMVWMGVFGLAYLPSTCLPVALHSNGCPIGMQVVGPFLEDHTALAAAATIEALLDRDWRAPRFRSPSP